MSTVKVSHIKKNKVVFEKKTTEYKQCLEYIRYMKKDPSELIPDGDAYELYYNLDNTFPSFANGIRRCIMDENVVKGLSCEIESVVSDDDFLLVDKVISDINSVPINQDIDYKGVEFSLHVENKTEDMMRIYTRHLSATGLSKGTSVFSKNICIYILRPNRSITIKGIHVIEGVNLDDGNTFAPVHSTIYWPMGSTGKSTMVSKYTSFEMGYTTYRHSTNKPERYVIRACRDLVSRLNLIKTEMKKIFVKGEILNTSEHVSAIDDGAQICITINNEYWTIVRMISEQCYLLDPSIPLILSEIEHPSIEKGVIRIIHPEYPKLLNDSVELLIKNLQVVIKAFD